MIKNALKYQIGQKWLKWPFTYYLIYNICMYVCMYVCMYISKLPVATALWNLWNMVKPCKTLIVKIAKMQKLRQCYCKHIEMPLLIIVTRALCLHRKHLGSTFLQVNLALPCYWLLTQKGLFPYHLQETVKVLPVLIPWGSWRGSRKRIWVKYCWVPQFRSLQANLQFLKLCNLAAFQSFCKDRCFTSGSSS